MRILFTSSPLTGSRLIRWALEEPVSHVAIECNGIVLHSTWNRVDLDSISTFLKHRKVVYSVEIPEKGLKDLLDIACKYENSSYDFRGLLYFSVRALLRKFLRIPLPSSNPWNIAETFLCTELATLLLYGGEDGIITPFELYQRLLTNKAKHFKDS